MGDRIEYNDESLYQIIKEWIQMRNRYVELTDIFRQMTLEFHDYRNVDILTLLLLCKRLEVSIREVADKLFDIIKVYNITEDKVKKVVESLPTGDLWEEKQGGIFAPVSFYFRPEIFYKTAPCCRPDGLIFKNTIHHEHWLIQALGITDGE